MTIEFDAISSTLNNQSTPITVSHTAIGIPAAACVQIIESGTASDDIDTVTYGGITLNHIGSSPFLGTNNEGGTIHLYFLGSGVPTGQQDAVITPTSSGGRSCSVMTLTADGDVEVNTSSMLLDTSSITSPSVSFDIGGVSSFVYQVFYGGTSAVTGVTPLNDWTERLEADLSSSVAGVYTYNTVGTVNMNCGWTGPNDNAFITSVALTDAAPPVGVNITSVSDGTVEIGESGITISGNSFEATTGVFIISPTDDINDSRAVIVVTNSWNNTTITADIPSDFSMLYGTRYAFVITDSLEENAAGKGFSLIPPAGNDYVVIKAQNQLGVLKGVTDVEIGEDQIEYSTTTSGGGDVYMSVSGYYRIDFTGTAPVSDTMNIRLGDSNTQSWTRDSAESYYMGPPVAVGDYPSTIAALGPNHSWAFDGDVNDSVGSANGTNVGCILTDGPLCRDTTNSLTTNTTTDRVSIPTTADINNSAQTRKIIAGWFMANNINAPPKRIYGEGTNVTAFQFVCAYGNNLMFECVEASFNVQVYGLAAIPNRIYHLCGVFEGSGFGNTVDFYVDGVIQSAASPENRQPNSVDLDARGVGEFGDPAGTVGVGGDVVLLGAPTNGRYNRWNSWNGVSLTPTQIREELFEKGAIPDVTVTDQLSLDALANTVRPNVPLCIFVDDTEDLTLTADNITFDPLASIHVQYAGFGVLTWINTNGSNASIGSTQNSGTIVFENPVSLTINGVIDGAEIRIYNDEIPDDNRYNTELGGVESNSGTTFVLSHSGESNDIVIQMIANGYEELIQNFALDSTNQTITLFPNVETN